MTNTNLIHAMGHIDPKLIADAAPDVTQKKLANNTWIKWTSLAACFCLIISVAIGLIPMFGDYESPFVLTAYTLGEENSLLSLKMEEGQSVPIDTFVAGNGMEGFVFSHKGSDSEKTPLISIISTDFSPYIMADSIKGSSAEIEKIDHIDMEKTQQYIFFVPSKGEPAPYSLTISVYDEETSTVANLTIVIEHNDDGYSAKIEKINSYEIIGDIDELLKPYQEVLDRLDAEYGYKLHIPEDRKYSVYEAYKDLSPEEFEKQILEELNGSTEDFEGSGGRNFESVLPPS